MARREAYLEALGLTDWVRRGEDGRDQAAKPEELLGQADAPVERSGSPSPGDQQVKGHPVSASGARPGSGHAAPAPGVASVPPANRAKTRARVVLSAGKGSCLYLCASEESGSTPLASDLARVVSDAPVWGAVADGEDGQPLELLIAERLFSQVVIFGEASARLVFGGEVPETCGPARVTVVDDLGRLGKDPGARRSCWLSLKAAGVVSSS